MITVEPATVPEVRARHPLMLLEKLREHFPRSHDEVLSALAPASQRLIASAIPVAFVPAAVDLELVEVIDARLGRVRLLSLVEARQRAEFGSVLFKGFVSLIARLTGLSATTIVKNVPKGWEQLFRACGSLTVLEIESNAARLRLAGIPGEMLASEAWMACVPAGLRVAYELVNTSGTVEWESVSAGAREGVLRFRWR